MTDYRIEFHYSDRVTTCELTRDGVAISEGSCAGKDFALALKRMRETRWQLRDTLRAAEQTARAATQAAFMAAMGVDAAKVADRAWALETRRAKQRHARRESKGVPASMALLGGIQGFYGRGGK